MATFDYSTPGASRAKVTLIVRANNKYGEACPGDFVTVDAIETKSRTVMSTLMTEQEAEALREAELAKRAAAVQGPPKTVAMVESALAALTARAREQAAAKADAAAQATAAADARLAAQG